MMHKEDVVKIYNVVEEIKEYQEKIAKLKQKNKQLQEKIDKAYEMLNSIEVVEYIANGKVIRQSSIECARNILKGE